MEWKDTKLSEVTTRLGDGIHGTPKYRDRGEYYFINGNNLDHGRIVIKTDTKKVSYSEYLKYKKELNNRTLFVSINGTIGNVAKYNGEPCILGKSACYFNVKNDVDRDFIYYVISSPKFINEISNQATGTTIKNVSLKQMRDYKFKLPIDINDQQKIASILSSLDAKIENNNKINANLEAQAQALFKSWFVDFEPFQDGEFQDSELGRIPKGWKVLSFPQFLEASKEKVPNDSIPEFSVTNTGIHPRDEKFNKSLSKSSLKNKLLKKGNLVFGMSREILNWGVMKDNIGGVSSAYNIYIVDEKLVSPLYLELFIKYHISYFHDLIKPATREGQSLDKNALMRKFIYVPTHKEWDKFLSIYNCLYNQIGICNQQTKSLSTLRDTLLPKLMSGEIEV